LLLSLLALALLTSALPRQRLVTAAFWERHEALARSVALVWPMAGVRQRDQRQDESDDGDHEGDRA
jgi:hypothetical protein